MNRYDELKNKLNGCLWLSPEWNETIKEIDRLGYSKKILGRPAYKQFKKEMPKETEKIYRVKYNDNEGVCKNCDSLSIIPGNHYLPGTATISNEFTCSELKKIISDYSGIEVIINKEKIETFSCNIFKPRKEENIKDRSKNYR